jgi:hypothetical protein
MNPERKSMSGSSTDVPNDNNNRGRAGAASEHHARSFRGLRSRYHAFLEKPEELESPSKRAQISQGAINVAIFCALVVVILTAFGIGLSWFGGSQKETPVQSGKSAGAEAPAGLTSARSQPAGLTGHADVKAQPSPGTKVDGE